MKEGYGRDISVTSPPAIIGNLVVVGSSLGDNQNYFATRGSVRAYDVLTGQLRWTWDPIPRDSTDPAWATWQGPKHMLPAPPMPGPSSPAMPPATLFYSLLFAQHGLLWR